jgi:drug/metabolite transporter (DMT)-like permease
MGGGEGRARARLALAVGVCAISFAAIFFRLAAPTHPLVASAVRLAIAAAVLAPLVWRARRRGALTPTHLRWAAACGALYAVHFGAWVWSLTLTSVAASVTLVTATPLALALIAWATHEDLPSRRQRGALALAVVGIGVIGWADLSLSAQALVGDALALLGALAMALYLWVVRRLGEVDALAFMGAACGFGALALGAACLAAGVPLVVGSDALVYLALAAAIPQLVGHTLLTWSVRHVTPTVAGLATLGEPVGAACLGYLWLGEAIAPLTALGCAVTLAALGVSLGSR